jgi:hypothetical protein
MGCGMVLEYPDPTPEQSAALCIDGIDNDFDGAIDCADPECDCSPCASLELSAGDELSDALPVNPSCPTYHDPVDLHLFANDFDMLPACLDYAPAPGRDLFFRVRMQQGARWHFHVGGVASNSDPAVYVLDSTIDPLRQGCPSVLAGINACGTGSPEHFSFVAPQTRDYFIGVDELSGVPEELMILAVNAACGNGLRDHSEYCDPTDPQEGPVADCEDCRKVLDDGQDDDSRGSSFNDGPYDATILKIPDAEHDFTIRGKIDSDCDFDFFSFDLQRTARVTATLEDNCDGIDLQFWNESPTESPYALGAPGDDCTPKSATLYSGRHWVRVVGRSTLDPQNLPTYTIRLEFEPG